MRKNKKGVSVEEKYYVASQWQLMWRKFINHKLAIFGGFVLAMFYTTAIFCEFLAPQTVGQYDARYQYCSPQRIHFFDGNGNFHFPPFVYGIKMKRDPEMLRTIYVEDKTKEHPIYFLVHGDEYKLWNLFKADLHLFGVKEGKMFLFGTDQYGRDLFSLNLYATRISLSIGLIGVGFSFILGCILGGISGYYGRSADMIIQRIIEVLLCIPRIPLWMGLSAALPRDWPTLKVYFAIVLILSIFGWTSLARVIRGKLLELREEDFIMAAKIAGATEGRIIARHLIPSFLSYLIVNLTLAVPYMIIGETSLSFLGLGLQPPVVSWGTLLQSAQKVRSVSMHPWLLVPGIFVIIVILSFNFLGDGLRDAADPYK